MRVWIDNTGLHSVGRCLDGSGAGTYIWDQNNDVRGLLQFATLIIFSDQVFLNDFEPPLIADASEDIRVKLDALGFEKANLNIAAISREQYSRACFNAAEMVGNDLPFGFVRDERQILGLDPIDIPRGAIFTAQRVPRLVNETDEAKLARTKSGALDVKAAGAIEYMLTTSRKLRTALKSLIEADVEWSPNDSYHIEMTLRSQLNTELAKENGATYAPAISRAEIANRQNLFLLRLIGDVVDPIVESLNPQSLGIPSVYKALLARSKQEPKGIIEEAVRLRALAAELRSYLGRFQMMKGVDDPTQRYELMRAIRELGKYLEGALVPNVRTGIDPLSVEMNVGIPTARISGRSAIEWVKQRRAKGRLLALTEICKLAAFSDVDDNVIRRLIRNSSARGTDA